MSVLVGSAADVAGLFVDGTQEAEYVAKALALSPIAYWILGEHSPATEAICQVNRAQNGTYSNVTLGNVGIGDGQVCPSFDGVSSYVDIYSAALAAAFNGAEGTVIAWYKASGAGVWTDGQARRLLVLQADVSNVVVLRRTANNGEIRFGYVAGGTIEVVDHATGSPATFFVTALTWSKSAGASGEMKAYYGGAQVGATQTSLGVWAGSLGNTSTVIGANSTTPGDVWSGEAAQVIVWDSALTPAQIASLATV